MVEKWKQYVAVIQKAVGRIFVRQDRAKAMPKYEQDSKSIWSNYPTLRVLKSVFWIAGILTGIWVVLILYKTGEWDISTTISAIVLLSVPEILLILVRIERILASIDGKLKDK